MKQRLNIAVLGLGTVGGGVPALLEKHREKISQVTGMEVILTKALVKDMTEEKPVKLAEEFGFELTENFEDIVNDKEIQIIAELIGGIEPARTFIKRSLESGKHVITANKDLIAQFGPELVEIAKEKKCDLYYEASVAGGIPILRTISNSLVADSIEKIYGIVNGTTNFMLTKMLLEKCSYEEALAEAQARGFAEADPTNDVDGIDAAYKMVILTQFSFGMNISVGDIDKVGIRNLKEEDIQVAQQLGYVIKLLGSAEMTNGSVSAEVGPVLVPKHHPLASVQNEMNGVFVNSSGVGESMYYGPGAGEKPTATSVMSDLITIAKNIRMGTTGHQFNLFNQETKLTPPESIFSKYYVAVEVPDQQGMLLKITSLMTEAGVSFDQILQQQSDGKNARVVIITHEISKAQMEQVKNSFKESSEIKLKSSYRVL